ncbi:uncharacterized protein LOC128858788 isoform X4 [Anastrepha ludens]|uniref:uncharacterized protein LOC128858788 isoform X4 n=1 Tax=Anastrepha ludens TaxID=28586 RepID=UPI0023B0FFA3|nr:uncharacterized protein LOC128858788 isoform X4 [Anastrepha ludens]
MHSKNILLKIIFLSLVVGCCASFFSTIFTTGIVPNVISRIFDWLGATRIAHKVGHMIKTAVAVVSKAVNHIVTKVTEAFK